jgi:hypothetical protein
VHGILRYADRGGRPREGNRVFVAFDRWDCRNGSIASALDSASSKADVASKAASSQSGPFLRTNLRYPGTPYR